MTLKELKAVTNETIVVYDDYSGDVSLEDFPAAWMNRNVKSIEIAQCDSAEPLHCLYVWIENE